MTGSDLYHVYILSCADGTLYTGICKDLNARLEKHNLGLGARYTRGRRPVTLAYYESVFSRGLALKRESEIKKLSRPAKLALINKPADSFSY